MDSLQNTRNNQLACLKYMGQPVKLGKTVNKIHHRKKCIFIRKVAHCFFALFQLLSCSLTQKNSYWLLSVYMLQPLELKQSRKNKFLLTKTNVSVNIFHLAAQHCCFYLFKLLELSADGQCHSTVHV